LYRKANPMMEDDTKKAEVKARAERALSAGDQGAATAEPLARFFVRDRGRLIPISAQDIVRLAADDDYVRVFTRERSYLVYLTLNDFERRLDAGRFMRIHRAHMVNIDFVSQLVPLEGGRMQVELHDGSKIAASRARSRDLRNRTI
jgi:two-component system LytT family response regulator